MRNKRTKPDRKQVRPAKPEETPDVEGRPVTTGDMQEVGATEPEEVAERRRNGVRKAPVHEDPGSQSGG